MLKKKEIENLLKYYKEKQNEIRADFKASYNELGLNHRATESLADDLMIHEAYISTIEQILEI